MKMVKKYNKPEREICCVVDQFCDAPANLTDRPIIKGECKVCGQLVCTKCSSKRIYKNHGKVRVCNDCQVEELDGNDEIVMKRMKRMAGYK